MASTNFSPGTVIASTWLNDVNVATYTTVPATTTALTALQGTVSTNSTNITTLQGNVSTLQGQMTAVQTAASNAQSTANAAQATSAKDTSGGYAGLTTYNINFKNTGGTFTSYFTNVNTASRTYTFPDKVGTVALTSDITPNNYIKLAEYVVTTNVGAIDFSNIFSDLYDRYVVEIENVQFDVSSGLGLYAASGGTVVGTNCFASGQVSASSGSTINPNLPYLTLINYNSTNLATNIQSPNYSGGTFHIEINNARLVSTAPRSIKVDSSFIYYNNSIGGQGFTNSTASAIYWGSPLSGFKLQRLNSGGIAGDNFTAGTVRVYGIKNS